MSVSSILKSGVFESIDNFKPLEHFELSEELKFIEEKKLISEIKPQEDFKKYENNMTNFMKGPAEAKLPSPTKKHRTFYDDWASSYDWDMLDMGYRLPDIASTLLLENMENAKEEDCFVIDVGAGTGFLGSALRKKGFRGILHGVDNNETMLHVADRKRMYDDLYLQHLVPETKIDISDELLYDGMACIASFGSSHIHPRMLPVMVGHVKTEGVIVFTVPNHPWDEVEKQRMDDEIRKLVNAGKIREVSSTSESYFTQGRRSRIPEKVATCVLYCYIKM